MKIIGYLLAGAFLLMIVALYIAVPLGCWWLYQHGFSAEEALFCLALGWGILIVYGKLGRQLAE